MWCPGGWVIWWSWRIRRPYDPKYKEWRMEDLPMMPEPFKLEVIRQNGKAVPGRCGHSFTGRMWARWLSPRTQAGRGSWWLG